MPTLAKHDPLALMRAAPEDITNVANVAQNLLMTSKGQLRYAAEDERRMNAILRTLTPGDPASTTAWKMADNSFVTLTFEELRDLLSEADSLAGPRIVSVFERAQMLKGKLEAGERVTMRDIASDTWL
uniref:DUF4376 domain-containing protein n=1 Tax=Pseudomonas phage Nican01 TaxID=3138540 RepID=A0AAU6W0Q3_9CAUD